MITKKEFNLRFLAALHPIDRKVKDLGSGHAYHPLLRVVLLREARDDLKLFGMEFALKKWSRFIGLDPSPGIKKRMRNSGPQVQP